MKRNLPILALLLLTAGCQLKIATYTDEQVLPLMEGRTDSLTISVSLEYPVKGAGEPVIGNITNGILNAAFDLEEENGTVQQTATRYADNLKDAWFNEYGEPDGKMPDGALSWEDRINGYFSGRYGPYRSYMVEYFCHRGGVHGINTMNVTVFDTRTGDIIPEDVFFADGYMSPVSELIQAHLPEALEGDQESLGAIFEPGLVGPNGNYELTSDGVTWYYQPYDIAPFSLGVISVSVPWKELKAWVRE